MRLLISDPMDTAARKYLQDNNIAFDYKQEILPAELLSSISNYDGLIVRSRTKVTRDVLDAGVKLKLVGRVGSGLDNVDLAECAKRKIAVLNAPSANSEAVAEFTLGLVLAFLRNIPQAADSMKDGLWIKKDIKGEEIAGKTVGIVGYGNIGKKVDRIMKAIGAKTLIFSKSFQTSKIEDIFSQADIISLHLKLTDDTKGLINSKLISAMKPHAILVNTGRGELVDEEALFQALHAKKIKGAILDVFWEEPLSSDSGWRKLDNVLLTPHIAGSTHEALSRASQFIVRDVIRIVNGVKPLNRVV